jgi:glycosyltransferase involved in cell wall biosynthesis
LLPRVIGQLRAQNYHSDSFEIIVVDNRSTDDTAKVVRQLSAESGVPVSYVFEPRWGITFARNRGARKARYPYLAYIDDDCSVDSNWLSKLMSGFDLHERVAAVGGLVLLHWDKRQPSWIGPDLEPWFANTNFLGKKVRLLEDHESLVESNTAFEKRAWQASGGFIGMEQFGSQNYAAGEVLHLLHEIQNQGGKIAFVPEALMYHHISSISRRQMLLRGYWQGISDAMLDYLSSKRSRLLSVLHASIDFAALLIFTSLALLAYVKLDDAKGMFYLTLAFRRFGFILSETHLVGDWKGISNWAADRCLNKVALEG